MTKALGASKCHPSGRTDSQRIAYAITEKIVAWA